MYDAMQGRTARRDPPAQTIAEGIAVKQPGTLTTRHRQGAGDATFCWSSEAEIEHALAMLLEIEKTVVEGAARGGLCRRAGTIRRCSRAAKSAS